MPKESTKSSQGRTPRVLDLLVRLVLVITLPLPITPGRVAPSLGQPPAI